MEPNQGEQSTKSTPKVAAAIPLPYLNWNMDDNPYNNKRAIFQSPSSAVPSLSFYNNNYHNYAGYGLPHPHAYYGYPGWSPSPILSASAPSSVPASMMLSPLWFGGPPPIPVATSTPLNPPYVCSTSSQIDSSMMDVQKEANGDFSVSGEDMQSLTEGMWDTTAVRNTNMDLGNSWTSNSMETKTTDVANTGDFKSAFVAIMRPG